MESPWNDEEAGSFDGPIGACVCCSRLIGSDPSLVLHGGGISSVKAPTPTSPVDGSAPST